MTVTPATNEQMTAANEALELIRRILYECDVVDPSIAYTVLVSLIADAVMLAPSPDEWFQELVDSVQECRTIKVNALLQEAAIAGRH